MKLGNLAIAAGIAAFPTTALTDGNNVKVGIA